MITLIAIIVLSVVMIVSLFVIPREERIVAICAAYLGLLLGLNILVGMEKLIGSNYQTWNTVTYEAEKECEKSLPRDQECVVVVTAVPVK